MVGMEICTAYICTTIILPIRVSLINLFTFDIINKITSFCIKVEEEEKSISLSPQLTPTVNFKGVDQ